MAGPTSASEDEDETESTGSEHEDRSSRSSGHSNLSTAPSQSRPTVEGGSEMSESAVTTPSRKRALSQVAEQKGIKRARAAYNKEFLRILNQDIKEAESRHYAREGSKLKASQIGASQWTSAEKDSLFSCLARLGRDNLAEVASHIGTKSEPEILLYLNLLQQSMTEKMLTQRKPGLVDYFDIPAALEISPECCLLLDRETSLISRQQEEYEVGLEKLKWGDMWLLTTDVAKWVVKNLERKKEDGGKSIDQLLPSAKLLKLESWLQLSSRIFMNPAAPRSEENWMTMQANVSVDEPSIRHTAFADFHALTISITKRLVHATIFHAMSRLRAMDSPFFNVVPVVRPCDVESACQVVGMVEGSKQFWAKAARRCNLTVYETIPTTPEESKRSVPLAYDVVERILSSTAEDPYTDTEPDIATDEEGRLSDDSEELQPDDSATNIAMLARPSPPSTQQDLEDSDEPYISESNSESDPSHGSSSPLDTVEDPNVLEEAQDEYAELLDQHAGLLEETSLRQNVLGQLDFPSPSLPALAPKPKPIRKQRADLVDWRERTAYCAEWEKLDLLASADGMTYDVLVGDVDTDRSRDSSRAPRSSRSRSRPGKGSQGRRRRRESQAKYSDREGMDSHSSLGKRGAGEGGSDSEDLYGAD